MNNENNPEEVVRAFKSYITKVIRHTAIDYIRKVKSNKYTFVVFNENIDKAVSLSSYDEDTAFLFSESENIFKNSDHNNIFKNLTKLQRNVLILTAEGKNDEEIANILNTTINSVRVQRNKARNQFRNN